MKGNSDSVSVILRAAAAVASARPSRWSGRRTTGTCCPAASRRVLLFDA